MDQFISAIERAFGSTARMNDLTTGQMSLRAVVVFVLWLVIVRVADKRMLGKYSAFDVLVAVILGAVLGRTINGSAPFWGSMAAAAVLVGSTGPWPFSHRAGMRSAIWSRGVRASSSVTGSWTYASCGRTSSRRTTSKRCCGSAPASRALRRRGSQCSSETARSAPCPDRFGRASWNPKFTQGCKQFAWSSQAVERKSVRTEVTALIPV
jgi:hypothetical protein